MKFRTPEHDRRIAALTRQGYSASQISAIVGVSPRSVVRARSRMGISADYPKPLPVEVHDKIRQLIDDGASYCETARTVGCHPVTIAKHHPGRGWTKQQAIEARWCRRKLEEI